MRWKNRRKSDNVEDRRGQSGAGSGGFPFPFPGGGRGGGFRIPTGRARGRRGGGMGLMGILIVIGIMIFFPEFGKMIFGGGAPGGGGGGFSFPNPRQMSPDKMPDFRLPGGREKTENSPSGTRSNDDLGNFIKVVVADTEDVWNRAFKQLGRSYKEPKLVLYSGSTRSGCGIGTRQMGPFYCPADQKIYIDLSFYNQLKTKFGAGGDFAQAYVVAHEVGHHIQTLFGISAKVQRAKARSSTRQGNALQVRMELQADCLAGVWAKQADRTKNILESGDIEEAMRAASAIGDDKMQKRARGYVQPESFTHGSSRQRVRWFKEGFDSGDLQSCDTFNASNL